jgi:dipeptidyl aminopeptidase/acylaminoacyl peptidase
MQQSVLTWLWIVCLLVGAVPINQSELLHQALKKAGVDVTFVRVKRGGHGFGGNCDPSPQQINQMVVEFFDKHLKPRATK